jgi:hypothetical protein
VVGLGKFIKKIQDAVESTKVATKFMAMGGTQLTLQKFYDIYFKALNGFATGVPSSNDKWAWKVYIIKVIDKKYNMDARERATRILKDVKASGLVKAADVKWIQEELIPYFEDSYKAQLKKVEVIINDIDLLSIRKEVNTAKRLKGEGAL